MLTIVMLAVVAKDTTDVTWEVTRNAAIRWHNTKHVKGKTVAQCKALCLDEAWCKSFDYYKYKNACDLSDTNAAEVGELKKDYPGNPYDHYDIPDCQSILVTEMEAIGDPKATMSGKGLKSVTEMPNCRGTEVVKITETLKDGVTQSHTDSYTMAESWSKTFQKMVGTSVEVSMEATFEFVKASSSVKAESKRTWTSTQSRSSSKTTVKTTIKSLDHELVIERNIPPFTWKDTYFTWQKYDVETQYRATAICKDRNGKEAKRKTISGTWQGAYLSQSKVMMKDKTNECETAKKCMCAGLVASTIKGGVRCSLDYTFPGNHKFCYIRAEAPCPNKFQLDPLDYPVDQTMWMKSGDPCSNPVADVYSLERTFALPVVPTCTSFHELSYPGDSMRVISDGKCGVWTCEEGGTYDIAECPVTPVKETDDCLIGGQVVKSSESVPLIYGTKGCITATCMTGGDMTYDHCDANTAEPTTAPTSSDSCLFHGEPMQNGENHPVINANGICIKAECSAGMIIYTSNGCIASNVNCILPNYEELQDGQSTEVEQDANGVCGEFTCTRGILDVRPCKDHELTPPSPTSHRQGMAAYGSLLDRLDGYLRQNGFRRRVNAVENED